MVVESTARRQEKSRTRCNTQSRRRLRPVKEAAWRLGFTIADGGGGGWECPDPDISESF